MAVNRFVLNGISYHGHGAIKEIPGLIKARGFKKAFFVTDKDLIRFKVADKVIEVFEKNNIPYEIFSDVKANPTIANVQNGVAAFKASGADFIVALGGGSAIDTAKGIGIVFNNPDFADVKSLEGVADTEFVRLTYTEGIKILEAAGVDWEYPVSWGTDLQSEHERYLVEKHFKKPVILTDYPKDIKAFYMKQNEDGKTVRAMDVLFPKIGEIIGGSEREASLQKLEARIEETGMSRKGLEWYLDTRRYGSAPHSGFGLGFERLLLFVTGMSNIRDVIPFPRTPKNAEY